MKRRMKLPARMKQAQKAIAQRMNAAALVLLFLGMVALVPSTSHAQIVKMVAVGDGTQFNAWAKEAHARSAANNNFTIKGFPPAGGPGYASMNDVRSGNIIPQEGAIWIIWDNTPMPNTRIWCYVAMDSVVAARGFFAVPRARLLLSAAILGPAGQNLASAVLPADFAALPAPIAAALNNAQFTAAMTSVTAAQAFADTNVVLAAVPNPPISYDYGPVPVGQPILEVGNPQLRQPVAFNIAGFDPITGLAVPPSVQRPLRKSLLVPFVNATNAGAGHFGNIIFGLGFHNAAVPAACLPPTGLTSGLNGIAMTAQLLGAPGAAIPFTTFLDDPLGGSWYFMEHQVMNTCPVPLNSQEFQVKPKLGAPFNPLLLPGPATRIRAIGRDVMFAHVAATQDSLGYVTWTCASAGTQTNLTVNGQNPWLGAWTGVFPGCPAKPNPAYPLQPMQFVTTDNPPVGDVGIFTPAVIAHVGLNENWP